MNLNSETYFSELPNVEMPRSTMDLSHGHTMTCNCSDLVPIDFMEIYPGDTVKLVTSKVIRLQTLINPIFGTLYADIRHFFAPNRILQDNWQGVMGENLTGAWAPQIAYTTPKIACNTTDKKFPEGSLPDHFGLPIKTDKLEVNALPIRAYHLIWNDYYRDENLQDPLNIYKGDSKKYFGPASTTDQASDLSECFVWPRKAAKLHDYFTSCLPAPQKSTNPVLIPLSGQMPVVTTTASHGQEDDIAMTMQASSHVDRYTKMNYENIGGNSYQLLEWSNSIGTNDAWPTNLWAKQLPGIADQSQALVATINDLRTSFQIQRMLERDAYAGSRYCELLRSHFGIVAQDSRLQRPEYLGGNRIPLNIHQVVNNSESATYKLGNTGAMSHTVDVHEDFVKSFVEHGWIISVMCIRWFPSYAQGIERCWSRSDRYSYYWPALAHLGNMAVLNKEIFAQGTSADDQVFGYQEAWADLRQRQNYITGAMRPNATNSLSSWTLSENYATQPYLSDAWIRSDNGIVDNVLAVKSNVADQVLADFWFDVSATRVMPLYSIPGLIDHF